MTAGADRSSARASTDSGMWVRFSRSDCLSVNAADEVEMSVRVGGHVHRENGVEAMNRASNLSARMQGFARRTGYPEVLRVGLGKVLTDRRVERLRVPLFVVSTAADQYERAECQRCRESPRSHALSMASWLLVQ